MLLVVHELGQVKFLKGSLCVSSSITEHYRKCRVLLSVPKGNMLAQWPCFCGLFCLLVGSAVELVAFIFFGLCLNTVCQTCRDSFVY